MARMFFKRLITLPSPSLFDIAGDGQDHSALRLTLESVERRAEDVLWLRYRVRSADESR